jgi:prephenate dehydrogenase
MMRITLLGMGLIGGSIARALRANDAPVGGGDWSIAAWTPSGAGPIAALDADVVDVVAADLGAAIADSEMIVLAAPPLASLGLLDELGGSLRDVIAPGAIITDVASTKGAIVARAATLQLPFVGGHPMAGREISGFDASRPDLFVDRPWVLVPADSSPADGVARVGGLARMCRARPVVMTAAAHDNAVAAISHLPLVIAAALVESVVGRGSDPDRADWPAAASLAAGGWASMTRLARGDAEMSAGIAATNSVAIAERLRELRFVLDGWLTDLEAPDPDWLRERFVAARVRLLDGSSATEPEGR